MQSVIFHQDPVDIPSTPIHLFVHQIHAPGAGTQYSAAVENQDFMPVSDAHRISNSKTSRFIAAANPATASFDNVTPFWSSFPAGARPPGKMAAP